jgi:cytochrome c-type biogenesis protein CcmH
MTFLRFVVLLVVLAAPGFAGLIQPVYAASTDQTVTDDSDQTLGNPADEARAVALGKQLRCVVCQSESINDSQADMARDMRGLVREKISYGWSDADILEYLRQRYGDFILLKPRFQMKTFMLWAFPPLFLIIAAGGILFVLRRDLVRKTPKALARARQAVTGFLQTAAGQAQATYKAMTAPKPQPTKAPAKILATPAKNRSLNSPSKTELAKTVSMRKARAKRAIAASAVTVEAASVTASVKKPTTAKAKPAAMRRKKPASTISEKNADVLTAMPMRQPDDIENPVSSPSAISFPENLAATTDRNEEPLTPMSGELLASKNDSDSISSKSPEPVNIRKPRKPRKPKEI